MSDPNNVTRGHASRRARASRIKGARLRSVPAPVQVVKPDPLAWAYALRIAQGDPKRISVGTDGSVTVHNGPIR